MSDVVDHIQTGHALLMQVIDRMRILLAKNGHQHVCPGDLLLAVTGGLHMHDGALDHALKAQGWLRVNVIGTSHLWSVVLDEVREGFAQILDVG